METQISQNPLEGFAKEIALQALFSHLPVSFYWLDRRGILLGCNQRVLTDLKISNISHFIGKHITEIASPEAWENCQQVLCTQESLTVEEQHQQEDGTIIHYLSIKNPFYDAAGEIAGVVGISINITAEKQYAQIQKEKQEAEQKAGYLKMAAGTIAHDLATPLATINMGLTALEKMLPDLHAQHAWAVEHGYKVELWKADYLDRIAAGIGRSKYSIEFAFHYTRMILNNLKHDSIDTSSYQMHNMAQTIDEALNDYPYSENEKSLLHWSPTINFDFWGSNFYMINIINNLLKNAYHFIKCAERGEIYIATGETDSHYTLTVKDTAQGAPSEVVEHMFDGYFSKRQGGTGLGLAFCKAIMLSFGGDVSAESVEGEFIEFSLKFPKTS